MELGFINDWLNLGQFGDLMDQRSGVVTEEFMTTSPTVGRLTGEGFADVLGRDQDAIGLAVFRLTTAFLTARRSGRLSLDTKEIRGGRLVRVGGIELESGSKIIDSVFQVVNSLLRHNEHGGDRRLSLARHLRPQFIRDGKRIRHNEGIVTSSATFNTSL